MTKKSLHNFFEGNTTVKEEMVIREWLEASETNRKEYFKARADYDAVCLNTVETRPTIINHKTFSSFSYWSVAATVAIVLGLVLFFSKYSVVDKNTQYAGINSITVPAGQRVKLILSDSSVVWLNSLSHFEYPAVFSKDNRLVQLNGEAFFEVKGNLKCPFIVSTGKGNVKVTGTKFNIKAYTSDNIFETGLMEGKVEVILGGDNRKSIVLLPNQRSIFANNTLVVDTISDNSDYLWKEGIISFKNKSFDEILKKFEQNYGLNIIMARKDNKVYKHRYTGKFRASDGLEYNLKMLRKSIPFNFERIGEVGENQIILIK